MVASSNTAAAQQGASIIGLTPAQQQLAGLPVGLQGASQPTSSPITSASIAPATVPTYQQPKPTPIYPVTSLNSAPPLPPAAPVADPNAPTSLDQQMQDLINGISNDNTQVAGQADYQTTQNQAAGIPDLQKTQNDLSTKLQGLQNEALAIPQQLQLDATGRGVTSGGLQPIQTAALRNNSIQALGISSLLETSKDNIANAQATADNAVAQKFDPIKADIAAKQANLQLIQNSPAYTQQEKDRAQAQAAVQAQAAQQVEAQKENYQTGIAMANAAMKNAAGDPAAVYAAQRALTLDPTDPQYLAKVAQLVGQYQSSSDIVAKALGTTTGSTSGSSGLFSANAKTSDIQEAVKGIINGDQPPVTTGLYGNTLAVKAELERQGYDLTKANQDYVATQKLLATLNGAQQTKLRESINQVGESLPLVQSLASQWDAGNFPALNAASLLAAKNGAYGQAAQSLATRLDAEIADVTSELATVYKGGNSSTDESLKLAATQLNSNWSKQTLLDAISLAQQNITYRKNSLNLSTGGISNSQYNPTQQLSKGSLSNQDFVAQAVKATGQNYNTLLSQVPKGYIGAVDNATGQLVQMLPSDFDASKYTYL